MISFGRVVYKTFFEPLGYLKKISQTGLVNHLAIEQGRKEMIKAAIALSEIKYPSVDCFKIYFLTGKKYWYQTAFCLYSLQKCAGVNIHAVIVDDGSFDDELETQVLCQFPSSRVVRKVKIERLLDKHLPYNQFPALRHRRLEYPHLRKITDIHLLDGPGPKLVLDSDMLFFRRPDALIRWLQQPEGFLFMEDVAQAYGYSETLMLQLCGGSHLPPQLNVGVAGIQSGCINWNQLEYWTASLLQTEGSSYYQEQALVAMLASLHPHTILDKNAYKVLPTIDQAPVPEILHHYVADAKYDYFVKGWRLV